jgi:hypothetical protein
MKENPELVSYRLSVLEKRLDKMESHHDEMMKFMMDSIKKANAPAPEPAVPVPTPVEDKEKKGSGVDTSFRRRTTIL